MIKTLFKHIKGYRRDSVLTPIFMIGEVVVEMIIPMLMASIVDVGIANADIGHIVYIGLLMLLMAALGLLTGCLSAWLGARASAGFAKNLREAMFSNIQTFSFSNIDRFSTSSLVTRLTTDVTNVQNAYQMILRMLSRAPFSIIVALILAFMINARLAAIYLVAVLVLGVILIIIIALALKYFRAAFPKYDALNENIQENVAGIRVVKTYVKEDREIEKFNLASMAIYKMFTKAEKIVCLNNPVMNAAIYTCILLISWIGANMIITNELTTGQLMSLLTYCINILASLMMVSFAFVMITMSQASAERICEVLNEKSDLSNPENPIYEVKDGSIEFRNVSFSYSRTSEESVLKDINLNIKSGEVIGIMGGTGSAKTTLINMISRLYDVDEGSVTVGGVDVRDYDMDTLRNSVAVVLQKNELFSGTILDNLRWGKEDATLEECKKVCRIACADEFIDKMPKGYDTYIEQGGSNVSGGQKQRLCIARALLKDPKVLILDDSTSAVDTATDAKIRKAFKEEIPKITKIIIAQRISSIKDADHIIVLNQGKIDAFDTHENLLKTNEIYKEVYESQTVGNGDFDEIGGDM